MKKRIFALLTALMIFALVLPSALAVEAVNPYESIAVSGSGIINVDFGRIPAISAEITYSVQDAEAENKITVTNTYAVGDGTQTDTIIDETLDSALTTQKIYLDKKCEGIGELNITVSEGVTVSAIKFYKDGFAKLYAYDADFLRSGTTKDESKKSLALNAWAGMIFTELDFGDGADEVVLDVWSADWAEWGGKSSQTNINNQAGLYISKGDTTKTPKDDNGDGYEDTNYIQDSNFQTISGKYSMKNHLAFVQPIDTKGWNNWTMQHALVKRPEDLQGIINVNMFSLNGTGFGNVYAFQFNKAVNPYENLIVEGEAITVDEIKSVNFGETGAKAVEVSYTGTGSVEVYKDSENGTVNMTAFDTYTLGETGTDKILLDISKYQGIADLYFKASDGVEITQIKYVEQTMEDPFENKAEINTLYVGGADETWKADIEAEFESATEILGRTYNDTYVNVDEYVTDIAYLGYLKNFTTDADIVFIQNNNKAEKLISVISELETKPYTVVSGESSTAEKYNTSVFETGVFEKAGTYAKPELVKKDIYNNAACVTGYDSLYAISGQTAIKISATGVIENLNSGSYIQLKNVNFDKGIGDITLEYGFPEKYSSQFKGGLAIKIDSPTGEVIATFPAQPSTHETNFGVYKQISAETLTSVYGVHDVYICVNSGKFGNTKNLTFIPAEEISYNAELNVINATNSETLPETVDDKFYNVTNGNSISYNNVRFTEVAQNYAVSIKVAAIGDGKILIKSADETIASLDLEDSEGNIKELTTITQQAVSGLNNLTVSYEGNNSCVIKSIKFSDILSFEGTTFGPNNHSAVYEVNATGKSYGGFGKSGSGESEYVVWKNVDFGTVAKQLEMTVTYSIGETYGGSLINLRADRPDGPIVGQLFTTYASGDGWSVKKIAKTSVLYKPEGVHDLYLTVGESGYETNGDGEPAADIYSIQISEIDGNPEYLTTYEKLNPQGAGIEELRSTVTFINNDVNLKQVFVALAVYNESDMLVDVNTLIVDTTVGLNSAVTKLPYSIIKDGKYTVKAFIWNGETYAPMNGAAEQLDVIEVTEE